MMRIIIVGTDKDIKKIKYKTVGQRLFAVRIKMTVKISQWITMFNE